MKGLIIKKYCGKFRDCDVWVSDKKKDSPRIVPKMVDKLCETINNKKNADRDWIWETHWENECIHPFVDVNERSGQ